jgi:hypothetical protein
VRFIQLAENWDLFTKINSTERERIPCSRCHEPKNPYGEAHDQALFFDMDSMREHKPLFCEKCKDAVKREMIERRKASKLWDQ